MVAGRRPRRPPRRTRWRPARGTPAVRRGRQTARLAPRGGGRAHRGHAARRPRRAARPRGRRPRPRERGRGGRGTAGGRSASRGRNLAPPETSRASRTSRLRPGTCTPARRGWPRRSRPAADGVAARPPAPGPRRRAYRPGGGGRRTRGIRSAPAIPLRRPHRTRPAPPPAGAGRPHARGPWRLGVLRVLAASSTRMRNTRIECAAFAIASTRTVSGSPGRASGNCGMSMLSVASAAKSPGYQNRSADHDHTRVAAILRGHGSSRGAVASHCPRSRSAARGSPATSAA